MKSQLFSVTYPDKHAAVLMFKKIQEIGGDLGVIACGMEKIRTRSKRIRSQFKIIVAIENEFSQNLPNHLKIIEDSLKDHKLYTYLNFDFCIIPISQTAWNFDSYDDSNYQDIFIRKRS